MADNNSTNTSTSASNLSKAGSSGAASGEKKPDSIKEALRILDDALAGKSGEFTDMIGNEFQNIKKAVRSVSSDTGAGIRDVAGEISRSLSGSFNDSFAGLNTSVRSNPWAFIGGFAASTFAVGLILGGRARSRDFRESLDSRDRMIFDRRH